MPYFGEEYEVGSRKPEGERNLDSKEFMSPFIQKTQQKRKPKLLWCSDPLQKTPSSLGWEAGALITTHSARGDCEEEGQVTVTDKQR